MRSATRRSTKGANPYEILRIRTSKLNPPLKLKIPDNFHYVK
jgi:hypothetical protein